VKNEEFGQLVKVSEIDKDSYRISPPMWTIFLYVFVTLAITPLLFQPSVTLGIKTLLVAIISVIWVGLFRLVANKNRSVTLIADQKGLYFPSRTQGEYFLIPWTSVLAVEKTTFPLNSRGLRVEVDCKCFAVAAIEIGNITKEHDRCFVYTIPQLRDRDKLIEELECIKRNSIKEEGM
jgi:hypothetical protein